MKKVKVHVVKEVEIEIDDKSEVLDCDTNEWIKRYREGKITQALMEECIKVAENRLGVPFYDPDAEEEPTEYISWIEGTYAIVEG